MPARILHIINSFGTGGAEKLLAATINGLTEYEHHLMILSDDEGERPVITVPHQFTNLNMKSRKRIFFVKNKVRKYILENKIDLVHAHLYDAIILARLSTPRNIPLFNSIHAISSLAAYKGNKLILYLERLTYKKRHHIIGVSAEVLKDFAKHVKIKGRTTVLYNFIEENFFTPQPKKEFSEKRLKLVSVGNLRYQKNYPYIIEAFKSMPAEVSLDIYGEGSMREELQAQIDKHKLNIELKGLHKDMHRILPRYDAFLMSSFYEGQPLSLLEAMASGLPAILSDIPVLREVTGVNAAYFNIDDPDNLRNEVKKILDGKTDLRKFAAESHKRVNEIAHASTYFSKLRNLYEEALHKR